MGGTHSVFFEAVVTVLLAITTVAIVALVLSKKANTPAVFQSFASGFGNALAVAEAPVTGAATPINLSYPSQSNYGYGLSGFSPQASYPAFG